MKLQREFGRQGPPLHVTKFEKFRKQIPENSNKKFDIFSRARVVHMYSVVHSMHCLGLCSPVTPPEPCTASPAPHSTPGVQCSAPYAPPLKGLWVQHHGASWAVLPVVHGVLVHHIVRWYLHTTSDLTTTASQLSNRNPLSYMVHVPRPHNPYN